MTIESVPAISPKSVDSPQAATGSDMAGTMPPGVSTPMLDVHAPHNNVHTWKSFFIHLTTISIGLLIAIGLEQAAAYLHHRHQVSEIRESLRIERSINAHRFSVVTEEFHRFIPKLQGNLAIFQYLLSHPGAPADQWPGTLTWFANNVYYQTSAWETAQRSGILEYMPRDEVQSNADLYGLLKECMNATDRAREAKYEAARFGNVDANASHMNREQIAREIDLISETLLSYGLAANRQRSVAEFYNDFAPAPSAEDVQRLAGITWSDKEQAAYSEQQARIRTFEEGLRAHSSTR
jgi:hypothetical protein